jgi:hypothetical protein
MYGFAIRILKRKIGSWMARLIGIDCLGGIHRPRRRGTGLKQAPQEERRSEGG